MPCRIEAGPRECDSADDTGESETRSRSLQRGRRPARRPPASSAVRRSLRVDRQQRRDFSAWAAVLDTRSEALRDRTGRRERGRNLRDGVPVLPGPVQPLRSIDPLRADRRQDDLASGDRRVRCRGRRLRRRRRRVHSGHRRLGTRRSANRGQYLAGRLVRPGHHGLESLRAAGRRLDGPAANRMGAHRERRLCAREDRHPCRACRVRGRHRRVCLMDGPRSSGDHPRQRLDLPALHRIAHREERWRSPRGDAAPDRSLPLRRLPGFVMLECGDGAPAVAHPVDGRGERKRLLLHGLDNRLLRAAHFVELGHVTHRGGRRTAGRSCPEPAEDRATARSKSRSLWSRRSWSSRHW